ncbi:sugar ABC transporter permease [Paenibacillus sp. YN15]|uniref:ABC transporter permease n=1 Tax=Paenibacillus sp. YN15 TaxID=1742774 RepID=UPI00215D489D|nr:ABC transporter permease subunit [Paenibacillus sp. YN15]
MWKQRMFYVMLLPALVWYAVFRYGPMYGMLIAFKEYSLADGVWSSPWADPWFKYFRTFYESPYFAQLLTNTFLISLYKLLFGMVPSILLAIVLSECRVLWYGRVIQTLSYLPHFLSWVIILGISTAFFSQTNGLVNRWIADAGGQAIPFMTSTEWFRSILVGSDVWKDLGWGAIVYLAAISGIDPTLYEAARVDGASRLRMIWHITLPGIRSVIILLLIMKLGHVLDAGFEQVYVMYNIQVYPVADIIDTWVYRVGLQEMNFSIASAVGLFKSLIGLLLVVGSNKLAKLWGEGIW